MAVLAQRLPLVLALLGGCLDSDRGYDYSAFYPHYATSWRLTPGGITRDAGPFGSVDGGFTTEEEIDAALDAAHADYSARFPEFAWIRPLVHLTDDYCFYVSLPGGGFASGWHIGDGQIVLALWSRGRSASEPMGCWIKRAPGDSFGVYMDHWRYTSRALVPAYQHEALHVAIGDAGHVSPFWGRLN